MKKLFISVIFATLLGFCVSKEVTAQNTRNVTIMEINNPDYPAAEPNLCAFGNSIEGVTLNNIELVRPIMFAREGISVSDNDSYLNPAIRSEWERLNTRYVSVHIVQRYFTNDERIVAVHFLVEIYERVRNNYYLIASNVYE